MAIRLSYAVRAVATSIARIGWWDTAVHYWGLFRYRYELRIQKSLFGEVHNSSLAVTCKRNALMGIRYLVAKKLNTTMGFPAMVRIKVPGMVRWHLCSKMGPWMDVGKYVFNTVQQWGKVARKTNICVFWHMILIPAHVSYNITADWKCHTLQWSVAYYFFAEQNYHKHRNFKKRCIFH